MSARVSIPTVKTGVSAVDRAFAAVKLTLDRITGQNINVVKLKPLPATATLPEVIERLNEVVELLQGD